MLRIYTRELNSLAQDRKEWQLITRQAMDPALVPRFMKERYIPQEILLQGDYNELTLHRLCNCITL